MPTPPDKPAGTATPKATGAAASKPKVAKAKPDPKKTKAGAKKDKKTGGKKSKARKTVEKETRKLRDKATGEIRTTADKGKHRASEAIVNLGKLLDESADAIDRNVGESYGRYARSASKTVTDMAGRLDEREVDELLEDARSFVRKSPAVAIGAAAAIGFVITRIVKAGLGDQPGASDDDDDGPDPRPTRAD